MQVRVLESNCPVHKFVAMKSLSKPNAVVEPLETDCQLGDWQSKLVGLCGRCSWQHGRKIRIYKIATESNHWMRPGIGRSAGMGCRKSVKCR